jgi:LacI family repressor for deo operon, udp, cdd, tsx, nupC, and nupG
MSHSDRPATIRDVAAAVGLSIATVSRAISNPSLLNSQTLERVEKAIAELGYRPNLTARNLRYRETRLIMVVVPSLSPFFLEFFRGAEQAANETGYNVLVGHTDRDPVRELAFIDQVRSRRADGIVLVTSADLTALGEGSEDLPPTVVALDINAGSGLPTVRVDHTAAAEMATAYLLNLGHTRIAHIAGAQGSGMATHRLEGYQHALVAHGVDYDPALVLQGDFTVESGEQAMESFLTRAAPPTAVFAANDEMAVGAIRALRAHGFDVPRDVSVLGFDDQRIAGIYDPPLTTVRIPTFEIGYRSTLELARLLSGEAIPPDVVLDCELIVRGSAQAR